MRCKTCKTFFAIFLHEHYHKPTLSILDDLNDIWIPRRCFVVRDDFKSVYPLFVFLQFQFNPQKPGTVQQNRYNRNDGSKGRRPVLLSRHVSQQSAALMYNAMFV